MYSSRRSSEVGMSREFFVQRWEMEHPTFLRVFRALPAHQLDYKPHPRSASAGNLVWHITEEQRGLSELLDHGQIQWEKKPKPDTLDQMVNAYQNNTEGLRVRLQKTEDEKWNSSGKIMAGEKTLMDARVQDLFWFFFFDALHHRGQLSAYIRPMGGRVPSIYGPSGDDPGGGA
jgi:uncharacterized damage-inducible protein DinB